MATRWSLTIRYLIAIGIVIVLIFLLLFARATQTQFAITGFTLFAAVNLWYALSVKQLPKDATPAKSDWRVEALWIIAGLLCVLYFLRRFL